MIFLDTTYLIGLIFSTDANHLKSKQLSKKFSEERKAINNVVLIEVLNSLDNYKFKLNDNDVFECLLKLDYIDILNKRIICSLLIYLNIMIKVLIILTALSLKLCL